MLVRLESASVVGGVLHWHDAANGNITAIQTPSFTGRREALRR